MTDSSPYREATRPNLVPRIPEHVGMGTENLPDGFRLTRYVEALKVLDGYLVTVSAPPCLPSCSPPSVKSVTFHVKASSLDEIRDAFFTER